MLLLNRTVVLSIAVLTWLEASTVIAADIKTTDGQIYNDAKVTSVEPDGVNLIHRNGVAKVPFEKLSKDIQKQYHYDAAKAARYHSDVAERQHRGAQAAALAESQRQARLNLQMASQPAASPRMSAAPEPSKPLNDFRQAVVDNPMPVLIVAGILLLGVGIAVSSAAANSRRREHHARLVAEAKEYIETAKAKNGLPTVSTKLFLKSGENAFYDAPCSLAETRAVRHYAGGRVGFRVAKGVWVGGSQGRGVSSQEWTEIDTGNLTVTNYRLVFDGVEQNRTVPMEKILSADPYNDGLEVSVENRQKSMVFRVPNPFLVAIIIELARSSAFETGA